MNNPSSVATTNEVQQVPTSTDESTYDDAASDAHIPQYDSEAGEYIDDSEADWCPLDCINGGVCKEGRIELTELDYPWLGIDDMFHCDCPDAWAGRLCDVEKTVELCGEHHCFNGAQCFTESAEDSFNGMPLDHCDCIRLGQQDPDFPALFAGLYCQYPASTSCGSIVSPDYEKPIPIFCTNGGTCPEDELMDGYVFSVHFYDICLYAV